MDCVYNADGIIFEPSKQNILYSISDKPSTLNQENNKNELDKTDIRHVSQYENYNMSLKNSSEINELSLITALTFSDEFKKLLLNHSC